MPIIAHHVETFLQMFSWYCAVLWCRWLCPLVAYLPQEIHVLSESPLAGLFKRIALIAERPHLARSICLETQLSKKPNVLLSTDDAIGVKCPYSSRVC